MTTEGGKRSSRPYTSMYVGAIGMGFTTADLKSMPLSQLLWFIHCNNENQTGEGEKEQPTRRGTVKELKKIL